MAKIDKIDTSNMSVKEIKALEKQLEKEAKATKVEKNDKTDKTKKTDEFDSTSSSVLSDYKIEDYVKNYVENLIKKYDGTNEEALILEINLIKKYDGYDDIISRLRSYLGNFDIQDFRQDYPELSNTSDLATAMYNDTKKFL